MTKSELIEFLEPYADDDEVIVCIGKSTAEHVVSSGETTGWAIESVDDGWQPSGVATIVLGDFVTG